MKLQRVFIFAVLITVVIGIGGLLLSREPHYQGRSLSSWLQQCLDTPLMETQRLAEAQAAVRAMPIRQVLPRLVKLVETKEDPASRWIMAQSEKLRLNFLKWHSAEDLQQLGIAGFEVLGTNTAPAVGALTKLLDDPDHAFSAFRCLDFIGKPAESALCRCLTNQNANVRQMSIANLASFTEDVELYINRVKGGLGDPVDFVRAAAVDGIGAQTGAPDLAVPLLITALKDSSDMVSSRAANALAEFGTNAADAFPSLTNLVEHGGVNTANASLKTLVMIAPDESFSILTNCIARGNPFIGGSLKVLAEKSPTKALPILLACIHSSVLNQRRVACRLLQDYPLTPDVRSAIESATADPDPIIARSAKMFLTGQYRKARPAESWLQAEPSYEGKRLDEWLGTKRNPDGSFSKDAEAALRHMGTNAIRSLLARLVYTEPPFGLRTRESNQKNTDAICAFIALGDAAMPALPQLQALMNGTNETVALYAMMSACGTGSNAMPFLIQGLTNSFANVRSEAVNDLQSDLGTKYPEQRKQAVPLLVKLLSDPEENIRASAINALKEIDPAAAAKAGIK